MELLTLARLMKKVLRLAGWSSTRHWKEQVDGHYDCSYQHSLLVFGRLEKEILICSEVERRSSRSNGITYSDSTARNAPAPPPTSSDANSDGGDR